MAACEEIRSDITRCFICSDTFNVPKQLPCLHNFCETCLQTYINKSFTKDGTTINKEEEDTPIGISCPLCRAFIVKPEKIDSQDWAKTLPTNLLFHTLIALKNKGKGPQKCNVCERETESKRENGSESASYWCASCYDALCESCERQHRKFRPTSSHKVIGIDDIQATSPSSLASEITCEEHEEVYKYYCSDHSLICCMTCVVLKHRQCEHVVTADKAAEAKRKSNDDKSLMTCLSDLKRTYQDMVKNREQSTYELRGKLESTRQIVKKSYGDFIRHLTKAESITLKEIDECEKQLLPGIEKEKVDMECKVAGLDNNLEFLQLTSKHGSPVQYLYTMKKLMGQNNSLQTKFDALETIDIHFTPHETLSEMLKTNDRLGSISVFRTKPGEEGNTERKETLHSAQTVALMADITQGQVMNSSTKSTNVKKVMVQESSSNRGKINEGQIKDMNTTTETASVIPSCIKDINIDGHITSTAILDDGTILISKHDNKSLALICRDGRELSSLGLDNKTWGIRMISPTEGAIVVINTCLQFFMVTNNDIVRGDSLNVLVKSDFTFHRNHYYIGGGRGIMVYNSLLHHVRDITILGTVYYIAVRDDTSLCYTVWRGHELYCVTMDGTPVFTYSHDKLRETTGVTVDIAGYIYVCCYESKSIHQLSHEGKLHRIIFDNLPARPYCISFNTRDDKAVIGCSGKVFLYNLN